MKLFLYSILSIFLLTACSSTDDAAIDKKTEIEGNNELQGVWILENKINKNSKAEITTDCDLQHGKIIFTERGSEAEITIGSINTVGDCEKSITSFNQVFINPRLRLRILTPYDVNKPDLEYEYEAYFLGDKLSITFIGKGEIGYPKDYITVSEQETFIYRKQ